MTSAALFGGTVNEIAYAIGHEEGERLASLARMDARYPDAAEEGGMRESLNWVPSHKRAWHLGRLRGYRSV